MFMRLFTCLLLLASISTLTACGGYNALDRRDTMLRPGGDYLLGAGDKIKVTVFNEVDLSGEFTIDETGNYSHPLIGTVQAQYKSTRDLEREITTKLRGHYLTNPRVNVEVMQYRPFYVIGQVNSQGEYEYKPGLNAINAIAIAGGFTPRANKDVVFIKQHGKTGEQAYKLNDTIMILPGDTVNVVARYF